MPRRRFGALAIGAAAACMRPTRAAAQEVGLATRLGGGIARSPQDRYVFVWQSHPRARFVFTLTVPGDIYVHRILNEGGIDAARRIGAVQVLDASVRWVVPDTERGSLYVVRSDGEVVHHPILLDPSRAEVVGFGPAARVEVPGPVGVNREDRRMLILRDRLVVFRSDGLTGVHRFETSTRWRAGTPTAPDSHRPVASQPQDKWLVPLCGSRIGVVTERGELFVHGYDRDRDAVLAPTYVRTPQPLAASRQDRLLVASSVGLYVVTSTGDLYEHPLRC